MIIVTLTEKYRGGDEYHVSKYVTTEITQHGTNLIETVVESLQSFHMFEDLRETEKYKALQLFFSELEILKYPLEEFAEALAESEIGCLLYDAYDKRFEIDELRGVHISFRHPDDEYTEVMIFFQIL